MANKNTYCNDPDEAACLDALIKLINDDLTVACQIPFTVPKKELANIINKKRSVDDMGVEEKKEPIVVPRARVVKVKRKRGKIKIGKSIRKGTNQKQDKKYV